ncbi:TetR/AcrR family transcriptional regulator [uncultured Vagococcus sp.]|uniref:TetR/AcrR family transcriptional regulator n=1 Tax=uncultured Vagococcus sp. TaxID=189676 RepID=UPI0028D8B814|nr:TetR/AcrR family transcriptional regulator [uncultured Vagococcus sp.]
MPKVSEAHKEEMRRKIRASAKALFLQKGFRAVTMKDIVTASGLSFGAVYSYYSNTSDIFLVLKQEEILTDHSHYQLMLTATNKAEFVGQFLTFLTERLSHLENTLVPATYDYLTFVAKGAHHTAISDIVYRELEQQIYDVLQQGEKAGLINTESIETIANFLLVYVEGLYFQQAFVDSPPTTKSLKSLGIILNQIL